MNTPEIKINLDAKCKRCGQPGAAQNGLCLKCVAEKITGGNPKVEVKVMVPNIENLKTSTALKEEIDKNTGEIIERRLVTKVQFEAEIDPIPLANVHRMLSTGSAVHVLIGSPQAIMDMAEKEGALAEV